MSLPPALQPWWPFFKRIHLRASRVLGHVFRALSPLLGARGVPRTATDRAVLTAAGEPGAVVLHPGREEVPLDRPATPGDPPGHWLFEAVHLATEPSPRVPAVTVPATFTLEIASGRMTGDYGAATTPGKVLDHETSTYFGVVDWREHPIFLRPTLGPTEHLPGTALSLTTRGTTVNYYHFLYDAIGRLAVLEDSLPDWHADTVIVPHQAGYQRQLLALAGVTGRLVQPVRGRSFSADRLLVPSNPNWALQAPPATVAWLRDRLRPSPAAGGPDAPSRLYITRGTARRTRRYVEEAELWPELERRGFVKVDPGTFSVQEQIDLFSGAEVIVSPHGAGLTNVTFSPPGVRVLEMFAATYVHLGLWAICQAVGADYHYLVADGSEGPDGANAGILDDVSIPPARVLAAVDDLVTELRGRP